MYFITQRYFKNIQDHFKLLRISYSLYYILLIVNKTSVYYYSNINIRYKSHRQTDCLQSESFSINDNIQRFIIEFKVQYIYYSDLTTDEVHLTLTEQQSGFPFAHFLSYCLYNHGLKFLVIFSITLRTYLPSFAYM